MEVAPPSDVRCCHTFLLGFSVPEVLAPGNAWGCDRLPDECPQ